jgi:hypothetical protein
VSSTIVCAVGAGPHAALLELARPPLEAWARRFGYDLDLRTELVVHDRPAAWSKVRLVRDHLETHRFVVWIDADTVVVDGRDDITRRVNRRRPIAMVAHSYAGQTVPNFGFFVMRSTRRSKQLLDQLWSMTQYLDHKWLENAALLDLLGYDIEHEPIRKVRPSDLDARIEWLGNEWNSISLDAAARPIINHYPGHTNEDRSRLMLADVEAWRARQSAG